MKLQILTTKIKATEATYTEEQTPIGVRHVARFICDKETVEMLKTFAVKNGFPFGTIEGGIKLEQWS